MKPDFEALLRLHMGLDAASIGSASVDRAVQRRRAACRVPSDEAYYDLLAASPEEIQELIEEVAVPETWFFRDPEAFTALVGIVRDEWLPRHPQGIFRVASLPCSTGEEPSSIAMALLEAGIPAERFGVEGIDISRASLRVAEAGIYRRNSFRGKGREYRDRFFAEVRGGWRVSAQVRARVNYRMGNVLAVETGREVGAYDAIFCRNLLIYFDEETQARALASLKRMLKPDGWLFVGPSETGVAKNQGFVLVRIPLAFAFQPAGAMRAPARPALDFQPPRIKPMVRRSPRASRPAKPVVSARVTQEPIPAFDVGVEMERAAALADAGRLAEAGAICERVLSKDGAEAQAHYVLGLVRDAEGNAAEAMSLYRKAIYLQPRHREAMSQLGALLKAQGRSADARVLLERAERLNQAEEASA
jgi:chemotaxis protein methyltransferase WspC